MSDNRVILVTGANRGIGYEAVKYLSQQLPTDKILLSSRSVQNGETAIEKMKKEQSGHDFSNVEVIELDITKQASLSSAVDVIREKYGKLTDLLHNTGISNVNGDNMSPEILNVNVRNAKDTIEAFLPLIPAKTGRIALVSSEVGAWYADSADESLRAKLEDVSNNDWPTIEKYVDDWVAFSQGKPSSLKWSPTSNMLNQAYGVSKALVTAWARNFAQTETKLPLAIVCPGYCATELNGFSGPRPASQGGVSVAWPLLNDYKTGNFYQDGKDLPIVFPMPENLFEKN
jgi:NAD(P)-dependent dehydrogenase (short-subunit alcohol dehydrogenase family)